MRLIIAIFLTIALVSACAHRNGRQDNLASLTQTTPEQVFCSELNADAQSLRLRIDMTNQGQNKWSLHKQVNLRYFKREGDGKIWPMQITRELLIWRKDLVVLAEVIPIENKEDLFMVSIISFEKGKNIIALTSNRFVIVRLCQEGEISLGTGKERQSFKVRLELIGKTSLKNNN